MVSVLSTTKTPRILIGRSGPNGPFGEIAENLRSLGYQVTEWESSRIGAHSTEQDVRDQVKDIDLAFLVIRQKDTTDNGGPIRPLHRILVEAGLMQGKMEVDRVVLLVEDTVDGLSADTGLSFIRFSADRPASALRELINRIETLFPEDQGLDDPPPPGSADRISAPIVIERNERRSQSDEFWVALRLGGLALLVGLLVLLLAYYMLQTGGDDDQATDGDLAENVVEPDIAVLQPGLAGRTLSSPSTIDISGRTASADEGGAPTVDAPSAVIGREPASPEATEGAANQLLPATCQINLRKGSLLDGAINCDGAGRLEVEGSEGPWHNEVAAVAAGEGTGVTLEFELRDNGTTDGPSVLELGEGTTVLNRADAEFGIGTMIVRFSGNGQHVHLFQREADGGASATLTFTLDR